MIQLAKFHLLQKAIKRRSEEISCVYAALCYSLLRFHKCHYYIGTRFTQRDVRLQVPPVNAERDFLYPVTHMFGFESGIDDVNYQTEHPLAARKTPRDIISIRSLFCAVIHQAFLDMTGVSRTNAQTEGTLRIGRDAAVKWLLGNSADFRQVCEMAGVKPEVMREAAHEVHQGRRSVAIGGQGRKPSNPYAQMESRDPEAF
jgi:hypothetical protein